MSSSPERMAPGTVLLRGTDETGRVSAARLDADLRSNPYVRMDGADPRLVDPSLARAFDDLSGSVREAAATVGYAAGYSAGYSAAVSAVREEARATEAARREERAGEAHAVSAVLASLERAVAGLVARHAPLLQDVADLLAPAAVVLAGAVVGREIDLSPNPGLDAVTRALAMVPNDADVVVRLHPIDTRLLEASDALTELPGAGRRTIRLVPDSGMSRGDAYADCDDLHVDACIGAALDRVASVLTA